MKLYIVKTYGVDDYGRPSGNGHASYFLNREKAEAYKEDHNGVWSKSYLEEAEVEE